MLKLVGSYCSFLVFTRVKKVNEIWRQQFLEAAATARYDATLSINILKTEVAKGKRNSRPDITTKIF